ncbi:hypothetical protein PIB30_057551 [Stylosanthes scabra]|uniref:Uncharacterized protein n=1 Tax=Stylosanthes scabra TaxID=79078 RepID=A0ABU6WJK5_9FABA|nr:hypothetical protein [Stylosanthes scabra]
MERNMRDSRCFAVTLFDRHNSEFKATQISPTGRFSLVSGQLGVVSPRCVPDDRGTPACEEQGQGGLGPCESGRTWMRWIRTGPDDVVFADRLAILGRIATREAPQLVMVSRE